MSDMTPLLRNVNQPRFLMTSFSAGLPSGAQTRCQVHVVHSLTTGECTLTRRPGSVRASSAAAICDDYMETVAIKGEIPSTLSMTKLNFITEECAKESFRWHIW